MLCSYPRKGPKTEFGYLKTTHSMTFLNPMLLILILILSDTWQNPFRVLAPRGRSDIHYLFPCMCNCMWCTCGVFALWPQWGLFKVPLMVPFALPDFSSHVTTQHSKLPRGLGEFHPDRLFIQAFWWNPVMCDIIMNQQPQTWPALGGIQTYMYMYTGRSVGMHIFYKKTIPYT